MKIKNNFFETLTDEAREAVNIDLTIGPSYYLGLIFQDIDKKSKIFSEHRQKIIEKHSRRDENGNILQTNGRIPMKNPIEFQKEFNEFLDLEVDLPFDKVKIDFKKETGKATPAQMMFLSPFIEDITYDKK